MSATLPPEVPQLTGWTLADLEHASAEHVFAVEELAARACLGDAQVVLRPGIEPRHAARRVRIPVVFEEAESEGRSRGACGSRCGNLHRLRCRCADDHADGRQLRRQRFANRSALRHSDSGSDQGGSQQASDEESARKQPAGKWIGGAAGILSLRCMEIHWQPLFASADAVSVARGCRTRAGYKRG